jgi:hypothetical protein
MRAGTYGMKYQRFQDELEEGSPAHTTAKSQLPGNADTAEQRIGALEKSQSSHQLREAGDARNAGKQLGAVAPADRPTQLGLDWDDRKAGNLREAPAQLTMGAEQEVADRLATANAPQITRRVAAIARANNEGPGENNAVCAATCGAALGLGAGTIAGCATLPVAGAECKECLACVACIVVTRVTSTGVKEGVKRGAAAVDKWWYGGEETLTVTIERAERGSHERDQEITLRYIRRDTADENWRRLKDQIANKLELKDVTITDAYGEEISNIKDLLDKSQADIRVTGTPSQER